MSPLLYRRRLQPEDLERQARPLVGRDIDLPAGPALSRGDEIDLLLNVLAMAHVEPGMRAAFTERLLVLLGSRTEVNP